MSYFVQNHSMQYALMGFELGDFKSLMEGFYPTTQAHESPTTTTRPTL